MIDTPNIPPTSPQTQQKSASSQHTIIKLPEGITSLKAGDILDALVLRHESSNKSLLQISAKNIQTGELPIAHKLPLATNSALQLEVTQAPKNLTDIPFIFEAKIKTINGQNISLTDTQLKQAFDVIKAAIPQHAKLITNGTTAGSTPSGALPTSTLPTSPSGVQQPSNASIVNLSNGTFIQASVVKAADNIASNLLPNTATTATNPATPNPALRTADQVTLHILSTSQNSAASNQSTAPLGQEAVKVSVSPSQASSTPSAPTSTNLPTITSNTGQAAATPSTSPSTTSTAATPQNASITAQTTQYNMGTSSTASTTPTPQSQPQNSHTQDAIRAYQSNNAGQIVKTGQTPPVATTSPQGNAPAPPTLHTTAAPTGNSAPIIGATPPTITPTSQNQPQNIAQVTTQTAFTASVVGTDKSGVMLLQSPLGTLKISTPIQLPNGASLTLEAVSIKPSGSVSVSEDVPLSATSSTNVHKAQLIQTFEEIAALEKQHHLPLTKHVIPETSSTESGKKAFIAKMLWFVGNAYSNNTGAWIGTKANERFEAIKARGTLSKLEQQWGQIQQHFVETSSSGWNNILIPVSHEEELHFLHFHSRRMEDEENDESNIRFVIEANLSTFGEIQLDGLVKQKIQQNQKRDIQMDITLRTHKEFSNEMKSEILTIFETASAITGNKGRLVFKVEENFPDPTSEPLPENKNSITV